MGIPPGGLDTEQDVLICCAAEAGGLKPAWRLPRTHIGKASHIVVCGLQAVAAIAAHQFHQQRMQRGGSSESVHCSFSSSIRPSLAARTGFIPADLVYQAKFMPASSHIVVCTCAPAH